MKAEELKQINRDVKSGTARTVRVPAGIMRFLIEHAASAGWEGNAEERLTMKELRRLQSRGFFDD